MTYAGIFGVRRPRPQSTELISELRCQGPRAVVCQGPRRRFTSPTHPSPKAPPVTPKEIASDVSSPHSRLVCLESRSDAAAEAAVEAISGAAGQEVTFSLELTQDQKDIRDWVHGFAADVVRPAAHEWDEKEQTPWPIIAGGREDRALRLRRARAVLRRPHRPDAADRQRGAVLGRRRHRHVDHGHRARGRGDLRPGLRRADRRVDPALLRHAR